jgi:hypothetical protein
MAKKNSVKTDNMTSVEPPVAESPAQPAPKSKKSKAVVPESQPVAPVVSEPQVVVSEPTAPKGKKSKAVVPESQPVAPVVVSEPPAQPAVKGRKAKATQETQSNETKPKRQRKQNTESKPKKTKKQSVEENDDNEESDEPTVNKNGKVVRSFKGKLPGVLNKEGNEDYLGRFTGLTPYQAANKALSKYFRNNNNSEVGEITFSICESTRNSRKSVYTYVGRRHRLDTPVEYQITTPNGEARTIVKNFKNTLTKVKKAT